MFLLSGLHNTNNISQQSQQPLEELNPILARLIVGLVAILQHNAQFRDNRCRVRQPLTPFLAALLRSMDHVTVSRFLLAQAVIY
jgi:hypothetical protein